MLAWFKTVAARLKGNIVALHYAARDPRTPWYAKAFVGCVIAYALSPIDLIPDMIPILGYLDDLLLVPFGIYIALKLIPPEVLADSRAKAATDARLPRSWRGAVVIGLIWLAALGFVLYWIFGSNLAEQRSV
ncbi:MAG TPA: YkvA family protein [Candidatus Binatia bacterium]|nr:YkvA family protein [Candidatus Binatia bacterium]